MRSSHAFHLWKEVYQFEAGESRSGADIPLTFQKDRTTPPLAAALPSGEGGTASGRDRFCRLSR
jgi:hypothetical protein